MLMMVEKRIRGRMCHAIYRYAKANNKYTKKYDKNKESSYLEYLDANNFCEWAMSKKLSVDGFEWTKEDDLLKLDKTFVKDYDETSDKGYIPELDV